MKHRIIGSILMAACFLGATDFREPEGKKAFINLEFLITDELEPLGKIASSYRKAAYLSNGDPVYLDLGDYPASKGDRFSIVQSYGPVKSWQGSDSYDAQRIQVKGFVEITKITPTTVVGVIREATQDVNLEDLIVPFIDLQVEVDPKEPKKEVRGRVIDAATLTAMMGAHSFAFINKGSKDGLKVNDRLFVYRTGDGSSAIDIDLPEVNIAELVVVNTSKEFATVYTLGGRETFRAGSNFKSAISEERYVDETGVTVDNLGE